MVTRDGERKPAKAGSSAPRPRDRAATRARVLAAVGRLIAREGFSELGVNAVAREAGVDKVLIYRYFGGLEGLLVAWGRTVAFGASVPPEVAALPDAGARAGALLTAFSRGVRAHPEALEVMRWELVEDSALTRLVAGVRESAGLADLAALRLPRKKAADVDLPAAAAVLSAGLLHLALRARTAPEWLGIPLRSDEGWARLERAAAGLAKAALSGSSGPRGARRERPR